MKFDLVVGNPPYNDDIYLDFVIKGKNLSRNLSLWIVPAKWQYKGGEMNDKFRKSIVPYIKDLVFFPEPTDIFNIMIRGGIAYFTVNNIKCNHNIKCLCKKQPMFNGEFTATSDAKLDCLHYCALSILPKVINNNCMDSVVDMRRNIFTDIMERGNLVGDVAVRQGATVTGYLTFDSPRLRNKEFVSYYKIVIATVCGGVEVKANGKVLGLNEIHKMLPNEVPKGSYPCVYLTKSEEECDSFISYMKTKFFRFLYYVAACSSRIAPSFFRYIPAPEAFNHIFTDEELYNKYNLTSDEINLIESVMEVRW